MPSHFSCRTWEWGVTKLRSRKKGLYVCEHSRSCEEMNLTQRSYQCTGICSNGTRSNVMDASSTGSSRQSRSGSFPSLRSNRSTRRKTTSAYGMFILLFGVCSINLVFNLRLVRNKHKEIAKLTNWRANNNPKRLFFSGVETHYTDGTVVEDGLADETPLEGTFSVSGEQSGTKAKAAAVVTTRTTTAKEGDGDSTSLYSFPVPLTLPVTPIVGPLDDPGPDRNEVLPHPHAGARHANGTLGLVVNPSPERLLPPYRPRPSCPGPHPTIEGKGGRKALEKIRLGIQASQEYLQEQDSMGTKRPRILCMIYTHAGGHTSLQAQAQTWARGCDGFWASSTITDHRIGAIELLHKGEETYRNMWQKIRSMWAYAYHYYLNDYDYFHIAGDDVYLIPDNLRAYLMSPSVQRYIKDGYIDIFAKKHLRMASLWVTSNSDAATKERPLLIGMPMFHRGRTFPAGGAGYTLNRAALKVFGERGLDSYGANATDSREDVFMGRFFWEQGIYTIDTRDETGAWRYLGHLEKMYHFDGHRSVVQPKRLAAKFPGYHYPPGMEGISAQVVSVHLKDGAKSIPDLMRRYHDVLYRDDSCPDYFNNKH